MFGTGKIIGVDISDASLEVVLVDVSGHRPHVLSLARAELPEGMVLHGVASDPNAVGVLLQETMKAARPHPIHSGAVVFTLPDRYTFSRIITIPAGVAKGEMAKRVREDAEGFVPMPMTEVLLDFFPTAKTETTQDIAYVAAPRAVLENMRLIAAAADVKLVGVDPEMLALGRLAFPPAPKTGFGIVDIGTRVTTIVLYDSRGLRRTAAVHVGGDTATNALIAAEHLTRDEAEAKKRSEGLGDTKKTSLLRKAYEPIVVEMERSMAEFERTFGVPVERIFLAGGTSIIPGLLDACATAWKKPVSLLDGEMGEVPRGAPADPFLLFAAAVGAARSMRESQLPRLSFSSFLRDSSIKKPQARISGNTSANRGTADAPPKKKFSFSQIIRSKRELYLVAILGLGLVLLFAFLVWKRPVGRVGAPLVTVTDASAIPVSALVRVRFGSAPEASNEVRGELAVVEREVDTPADMRAATSTLAALQPDAARALLQDQVVQGVMDVWQRGLTTSQILVPEPIRVEVVPPEGAVVPTDTLRVRIYGVVLDEPTLVAYLRQVASQDGISVPGEARFGDWEFVIREEDIPRRNILLEISANAQ